jgi:hypothetical protein
VIESVPQFGGQVLNTIPKTGKANRGKISEALKNNIGLFDHPKKGIYSDILETLKENLFGTLWHS